LRLAAAAQQKRWTIDLLIFSIWHGPPDDLAMLREWKLNLKFGLKRGEGASPIYLQIVHGLIAEIRRGRLSPAEVLPGSREMAEELGVNRKTVIVAYDELIAQAWLTSRGTKGTFVSEKLPESRNRAGRPAADNSKARAMSCMPSSCLFSAAAKVASRTTKTNVDSRRHILMFSDILRHLALFTIDNACGS